MQSDRATFLFLKFCSILPPKKSANCLSSGFFVLRFFSHVVVLEDFFYYFLNGYGPHVIIYTASLLEHL